MKAILQFDTGVREAVEVTDIMHNGDFTEVRARVIRGVFDLSNRAVKNVARPDIVRVVFNNPATVVMWSDDTKTVVKCQPGDTYNPETGLALCVAKKYFGNTGKFNDVFKKYLGEA